jgi:hypothetical protein
MTITDVVKQCNCKYAKACVKSGSVTMNIKCKKKIIYTSPATCALCKEREQE